MASPFLLSATDGKDLGYDKSLVDPYEAVALSGDRRLLVLPQPTGDLMYGGVSRATFPTVYLNYDTLPAMAGTVRAATNDATLQAAIAASLPGDVITVATAVYTGSYTSWPANGGDVLPGGNGVVTVIWKPIWDSMQANGGIATTRPAKVRAPASQVGTGAFFKNTSMFNDTQWSFDGGSTRGWRFIGLSIGLDPAVTQMGRLVRIGQGDTSIQTNSSQSPQNIIFDRCAFDGNAIVDLKHAVESHGRACAMIDCYEGDEIHHRGQDCQGIYAANGIGPFAWVNNRVVGSTENIMIGGQVSQTGMPENILIALNLLEKPPKWNPADPAYAGILWDIKNLLEVKLARKVLIIGNVARGSWKQNQVGSGFLVKAEAYGFGGTIGWTRDIILMHNHVHDVAYGLNIAQGDFQGEPQTPPSRVISFNSLYEVGGPLYDASENPLMTTSISQDCGSIHDTFVTHGPALSACTPQNAPGMYLLDTIFGPTDFGIKGDSASEGTNTLAAKAPGYDVRKCVFVGRPSGSYPPGNFFPAQQSDIQYRNFNAGDFALLGTTQGTIEPPPTPTPVLASIVVTPATVTRETGQTQQYTATGHDQFGAVFPVTPVWSVVGGAGVGTITSGGLFTAGASAGSYSGAIRATSGSVVGTASVTVVEAPPPPLPLPVPTSLVVSVQPGSINSGGNFSPQPKARVKDQYGNFINDPGLVITAAPTSAGAVTGGATAVVVGDTASWSTLGATRPTTGLMSLTFSAPGLGSVVSNIFTVTVVPPPAVPTSLEVGVQPADVASGSDFAPQPTVRVKDQYGGFINDPGVVVTAAILTGTGVLTGGNTAVVVGNTATYVTLGATIAITGANRIRFSAPGLGFVDSALFNVTAPADPPPPLPPDPPIISGFTATPNVVQDLGTTDLAWVVADADSLSINQGVGDVTGLTHKLVGISQTKTYTLTATNAGGTVSETVTVTVNVTPPTPVPVIESFVSTPPSRTGTGPVVLSWSVMGAVSLSLNHSIGDVTGLNSIEVIVSQNSTFILTATNDGGTVTESVAVTVVAEPPPIPTTPVLTSITISPTSTSTRAQDGQQFAATGYDQFGNVMAFIPIWSVPPSVGTISQTGLFVAGNTPGTYSGAVKAQSGAVSATATVVILEIPVVYPPAPGPLPSRRGICGYYTRQRRL